MVTTRQEATAFAARWAEAWNARDTERVLDHFHDDVVFTSPTALAVVGVPTVYGKGELREYWTRALESCQSLVFEVERVVWDADSRELAIVYGSRIDGKQRRVSENLRFDAAGRVTSAEVFHGVAG
jgi:ketosteroid isomerase-like protein